MSSTTSARRYWRSALATNVAPALQLHELWTVLECRGAKVVRINLNGLSLSTVGALIDEAEYRLRVLTEVSH